LVKAGLRSDGRVSHDGIKDCPGALHVVHDAALGVDQR
jgi:hypothetical protein